MMLRFISAALCFIIKTVFSIAFKLHPMRKTNSRHQALQRKGSP
jgi:hypothetical protein